MSTTDVTFANGFLVVQSHHPFHCCVASSLLTIICLSCGAVVTVTLAKIETRCQFQINGFVVVDWIRL